MLVIPTGHTTLLRLIYRRNNVVCQVGSWMSLETITLNNDRSLWSIVAHMWHVGGIGTNIMGSLCDQEVAPSASVSGGQWHIRFISPSANVTHSPVRLLICAGAPRHHANSRGRHCEDNILIRNEMCAANLPRVPRDCGLTPSARGPTLYVRIWRL